MPTFMIPMKWTDQGVRTIKDAKKRVNAARDLAKKVGVEIKQLWLIGIVSHLLLIVVIRSGEAESVQYAMAGRCEAEEAGCNDCDNNKREHLLHYLLPVSVGACDHRPWLGRPVRTRARDRASDRRSLHHDARPTARSGAGTQNEPGARSLLRQAGARATWSISRCVPSLI